MGNFWDNLMGTDEGAANYMETYGEGPGCQTRMIIGSFINDGESVLDVGCGPGWNLDHFLEYGPVISGYKGLDYSERFVRVANKRWANRRILIGDTESWSKESLYALGDVRDFGEPDKSWDVVILQDVLEHTNGYEKPIQEAMRVARKRIIVTFWKAWREKDTGNQINDDGNDGYGSNYTREDWENFLDSLDVHWLSTETDEKANRWHEFFILDLEAKHGK